jgi:hypothetical protein
LEPRCRTEYSASLAALDVDIGMTAFSAGLILAVSGPLARVDEARC